AWAARSASSIVRTTPSTSSARIRKKRRGKSSATRVSKRRSASAPRRRGRSRTRKPPNGPLLEFAKGFPDDPDLLRIVQAFEAGDYRTVRDEAPRLAERTQNPAVRDAALDLRRRIDADPIQLYLLGLTLALLAF